ncbi:MAG: ABC transporter substrate-binding protein [Thermodesulfobacteriota bacterium]|nr:ABC transporter substrate-binding protein [Thermodesulfobacteriota bacterium]
MKSNICFLFLSFIVLFGSTDVYPESVRGVTDTTIKIGALYDLTGPTAGDVGLLLTEALKNYTRHINDNGGIFGRKIKCIIEDDRYSIPAGLAAFKKLVFKDEILALTGPGCVGEARVLSKHIQRLKVPNITGGPDEFQVNPLKKYIFMPFNVYDNQLGVIFDYIVNDLKSQKMKITLVYFDSESGKVALASTKKWAKYFNFYFDTEIINLGAPDATSQVLSIKRKKSTLIVIHHTSPATGVLLRDLKKFGLDIPVYGDLVSCMEDTITLGGNASKNYIGGHPFSPWYDRGEGAEKLRRITLKYKPGTEKPYRNQIYSAGWIIAAVLYEGIKRAGKDLNSETLVKAWEGMSDFDTEGLTGPISFSPTQHQGVFHTKLFKADPGKGRFVPITDWRLPPEIK